jgi:opacity protein-like surface antigen
VQLATAVWEVAGKVAGGDVVPEGENRVTHWKPAQTAVCIAMVVLPAAVQAQESNDSTGEFTAFTGVAYGGIHTHVAVGGSAGASLSRYASVQLEASVIPMGNDTLLPPGPVRVTGSDLFDFNFALNVQIPVKRWEAYGAFGTAVLVNSYRAQTVDPSGQLSYRGTRHSKFGLEAGAGVKYYVAENWGIRAEYRYTSSSHDFNRILGGVFYQLHGEFFPFRLGFSKRRQDN